MATPGTRPLSVVIADDQPLVRDGLMSILSTVEDIVVVGVAQDGAGAVALAEQYDVDVVLMDLWMPGTGGLEATRALGASRPGTAVVVLSAYEDDETVGAVLEAGAAGYLSKGADIEEIRLAVRAAAEERRPAQPGVEDASAERRPR
jgi:DNA-binding NarL/FixJ family response regulator